MDTTIKPKEKNLGIEALPNLDFKYVCANSLIPLEQNIQANLLDDMQLAKKMQAIRAKEQPTCFEAPKK